MRARSPSETSESARRVGSCRGGPGRCRLWRALVRDGAHRSHPASLLSRRDGRLVYAGRVGTGINQTELERPGCLAAPTAPRMSGYEAMMEVRFAEDAPLEESRFEPLVPLAPKRERYR
jgi:hypothetical protein